MSKETLIELEEYSCYELAEALLSVMDQCDGATFLTKEQCKKLIEFCSAENAATL